MEKHLKVKKLELLSPPRTLNDDILWKNPFVGQVFMKEGYEVSRDV
jgi:hypothetical protein